MGYKKVILVTSESGDSSEIENIKSHFEAHYSIKATTQDSKDEVSESANSIYFLYLSDEETKLFLSKNIEKDINIALIPNIDNPLTTKKYRLSKDIFEAIDDGFNSELALKVNMLMCNGVVVYDKVSIGNIYYTYNDNLKFGIFNKMGRFFGNLKNLTYKNLTIDTKKQENLQEIASGVLVLDDDSRFLDSNQSSFNDGKLNAFVLSPHSIISYVYYLLMILFYQKFSIKNLPKSIASIKSEYLKISSNGAIDFLIDGSAVSAKEIEIEMKRDKYTLHLGRKYKLAIENMATYSDTEEVKLKYLPKGEIRKLLIEGNIPFFKKASDEDMKDAMIALKNSANLSTVFFVLMVLSTLLATTGLFQNSTPAIIGAMILAPLMAPIVSLSMGVVRNDEYLLSQSTITLGVGIFSAIFFSALFTLFMPLEVLTSEMRGRVNPNILDLMVAIFSGIAGAYANAKEEVAKSLAGVAIAVALVPPLCVVGIGVGWLDFGIIYGAFLLFVTNFIGITLSASLTFIVLGFAPAIRAKRRIFYISLVMILISIPLMVSFVNIIEQNRDYARLSQIKHITINQKEIDINVLHIEEVEDKAIVQIELLSNKVLDNSDYSSVKKRLSNALNKDVILEVKSILVVR
jgi:uncharacterized hydrophobic protein (TIGR00271 family)